MNTIAFIPLRGGSKSIPLKNIKTLAGKPLAYWAIAAALDSSGIDKVVVASDSEQIRSVLNSLSWSQEQRAKLSVIDRLPENASDSASTESVLLEFAEKNQFGRVVLIQATSPLLETSMLDAALSKMETKNYDSLLSVVRQKRFFWEERAGGEAKPLNYDPMNRPRRQDFDGQFVENGAFYITARKDLLASKCRISGKVGLFEMPEETYIEIDEPLDWALVQTLLLKRKSSSLTDRLRRIRLVVTDVDGVLTDAGMYYSEKGDELKKFNARDGKGFELLRNANIAVAIITQEKTEMVARRARKLQVTSLFQGVLDKLECFESLLVQSGLGADQVLYIGDDVNDLKVMRTVGVAACPADAASQIRDVAHLICETGGGRGCFREIADAILEVQEKVR